MNRRNLLVLALLVLTACPPPPPALPSDDDGQDAGDASTAAVDGSADASSGSATTDDDGTASAASTADDTGSATGIVGDCDVELLADPSFESWIEGVPEAWNAGTATAMVELTRDVVDGGSAVQVHVDDGLSIGQDLGVALSAGTCVRASIAVRWDEGSTVPPRVRLNTFAGGEPLDHLNAQAVWQADGAWYHTEGILSVRFDADDATFLVSGEDDIGPQLVSLDAAALCVVPCP